MKVYKKDFIEINSSLLKKNESKFFVSIALIDKLKHKELSFHDLKKITIDKQDWKLFKEINEKDFQDNPRLLKAILHLFSQNKSLHELSELKIFLSEEKTLPHVVKNYLVDELSFLIDVEQFGYKAAHLIDKRKMLQKISSFPVTVEIPPFLPLSRGNIEQHINESFKESGLPFLSEQWGEFCHIQGQNTQQLLPEAKKKLETIRKNIEKCFIISTFETSDLKEFCILYKLERLMVRSSGNEDSEDLDNSGGNETACNIFPDPKHISAAIATVIASYFSEKSLEQRLLAGDDILQLPTLATLIQVMIGSEDDPSRFVSGIGYKEEPLAHTKQTSCIHAAPGHGELLVNDEGDGDEFYVGEGEHIEEIIRNKPLRKAPEEKQGVITKQNSSDIARKKSLDEKEVITLHRLMGEVQKLQGGHVDIEFVVNKKAGTIYLVQSRPLIVDQSTWRPQYVDTNLIDPKEVINGVTVLGGNLQVLSKLTAENILCEDPTLGAAFKRFRGLNEEKIKIKCVLTQEKPGRMSHEANQFRRLEIPVIWIPNLEEFRKIKKWAGQGAQIWIETQTGRIYNAADLKVKEGLMKHPIPSERSLSAVSLLNFPEYSKKKAKNTLPEILNSLTWVTITEEKEALLKDFSLLLLQYFDHALKREDSQDRKKRIQLLAQNVFAEVAPLKRALEQAPYSPERLLPINFMRALIYQPENDAIIDSESIGSIAAYQKEDLQIIKEYGRPVLKDELVPYYFSYMAFAKAAVRKGVAQQWQQFVLYALKNPESNKQLAQIVSGFQKIGYGSYWLNTCFYEVMTDAKNDQEICLKKLWDRYEKVAPTLQWLKLKELVIEQEEKAIPNYAEMDAFEELFNTHWVKLYRTAFSLVEYISKLPESLSCIEEDICLRQAFDLTGRVGEVLDQNIKMLTGAPESQYPNLELKIQRFSILLADTINLLHCISRKVPIKVVSTIQGQDLKFTSPNYLNYRIKWLKKQLSLLSKKVSLEQLEISPGFDVQLTKFPLIDILYNQPRISYTNYPPTTLEEFFTTVHGHIKDILHNWQTCFNVRTNRLFLDDFNHSLPGLCQLQKLWSSIPVGGLNETSLSTDVNFKGLHLEQNVRLPGLAHEGCMLLKTHVLTGETTISLKMNGDDGKFRASYKRWRDVLFYALLGGKQLGLQYAEMPYEKEFGGGWGEVTLTWKCNLNTLHREKKLVLFGDNLKQVISLMMAVTMTDLAINDKRFAMFSFSKKDSLQQIIDNLSVVFGKEAFEKTVENLDEEFFVNYPTFNDQFFEYFKGRDVRKALTISFLTLKQTFSMAPKFFIGQLLAATQDQSAEVSGFAYKKLIELLSDQTFMQQYPSHVVEIAQKLLSDQKYSKLFYVFLCDIIPKRIDDLSQSRSIGMILKTLKDQFPQDVAIDQFIATFISDEVRCTSNCVEAFQLIQSNPLQLETWANKIIKGITTYPLIPPFYSRDLSRFVSFAVLVDSHISHEQALSLLKILAEYKETQLYLYYFDHLFLKLKTSSDPKAIMWLLETNIGYFVHNEQFKKIPDVLKTMEMLDPKLARELYDKCKPFILGLNAYVWSICLTLSENKSLFYIDLLSEILKNKIMMQWNKNVCRFHLNNIATARDVEGFKTIALLSMKEGHLEKFPTDECLQLCYSCLKNSQLEGFSQALKFLLENSDEKVILSTFEYILEYINLKACEPEVLKAVIPLFCQCHARLKDPSEMLSLIGKRAVYSGCSSLLNFGNENPLNLTVQKLEKKFLDNRLQYLKIVETYDLDPDKGDALAYEFCSVLAQREKIDLYIFLKTAILISARSNQAVPQITKILNLLQNMNKRPTQGLLEIAKVLKLRLGIKSLPAIEEILTIISKSRRLNDDIKVSLKQLIASDNNVWNEALEKFSNKFKLG